MIRIFVEPHGNHAEGRQEMGPFWQGLLIGSFLGATFGVFLVAILFAKLDAIREKQSFLLWGTPDNLDKVPQDVLKN